MYNILTIILFTKMNYALLSEIHEITKNDFCGLRSSRKDKTNYLGISTIHSLSKNIEEITCLCVALPWLPSRIKNIEWSDEFNEPKYYLPPNLIKLRFGREYNQPVDNLPSKLKLLIFGDLFNQLVDKLPISIEKIVFGSNFNKPIDNLPSSLEEIIFGNNFNQPVENLPSMIKRIIFGDNFNQQVNILPPCLEEVVFGKNFIQSIDNLPINLEMLEINAKSFCKNANEFNYEYLSNLSKNLSCLTINLETSYYFCSIPSKEIILKNLENKLPLKLKILELIQNYGHEVSSLHGDELEKYLTK